MVTLRVEDDEGVFVEVETTVTTTNSPPVVTVTTTNSPPVLTVAPPASLTVDEGILVTLTATATDAGSDEDCSARVLQKTRTLSAHSVHSVISSRELRRVPWARSASFRPRASMQVPQTPIVALSPVVATARRLSIVWGLHCIFGAEPDSLEGMVDRACAVARQEGFAEPGQRIIITAGVPLGTPGATNMLRIAYINADGSGGA